LAPKRFPCKQYSNKLKIWEMFVRLINKTVLLAFALVSVPSVAQAALQGRDLNGSPDSFEAYYDTVLDITWLSDANYARTSGYDTDGFMTWSEAKTWASNLSFHDAVNNVTYDNWRLPETRPVDGENFNLTYSTDGSSDFGYNITSPNSELAYMYSVNLGNPGYYTPEGTVSDCFSSGLPCTNYDPITFFSGGYYGVGFFWSGTQFFNPDDAYPIPYDEAWAFGMHDGGQVAGSEFNTEGAWVVSPGDVGVATIPEVDTWAMLLAGLGLVGAMALRRHR
jgi:hypothetical protein